MTSEGAGAEVAGRRLVHLATTDMSLALLLGPQLRAFADAGMEVIGASAPGPYTGELAAWGIRHEPVQHATRSNSVGDDVQALTELVRMFRRLRPDIVHTHNPKPGVYGRLAARLAGVPVVVNTVHGLYATPDGPAPAPNARLRAGTRRLGVLASRARPERGGPGDAGPPSGAGPQARSAGQRGGPRPLQAPARARPTARRSMAVADGKVLVGLVGRLVWEKGFAELFEAARRLRHTHPEVAIVVVGPRDPAKSNALSEEDVRAAEDIGNVSFLGERLDVEDLYPGMDLFVLPSYREGFPRSAMEASACGVPVVATDIRGCRQVVDHGATGLLVPVRDAAALADALGILARDPARRRTMSEAAVTRARAEFDDRRVIGITLDVYQRLLARGRPRRRSPSGG